MDPFIYILFSKNSNKYYIGSTTYFEQRFNDHNHSLKNTYTNKHRPWKLVAIFKVNGNLADAIKIKKFIKKQKSRGFIEKQKSRGFIEKICEEQFIPSDSLAQLLRVPQMRD